MRQTGEDSDALEVGEEMPSTALIHRLVLRPDFDVEVILPRNLTSAEAERISLWLSTLATVAR